MEQVLGQWPLHRRLNQKPGFHPYSLFSFFLYAPSCTTITLTSVVYYHSLSPLCSFTFMYRHSIYQFFKNLSSMLIFFFSFSYHLKQSLYFQSCLPVIYSSHFCSRALSKSYFVTCLKFTNHSSSHRIHSKCLYVAHKFLHYLVPIFSPAPFSLFPIMHAMVLICLISSSCYDYSYILVCMYSVPFSSSSFVQ